MRVDSRAPKRTLSATTNATSLKLLLRRIRFHSISASVPDRSQELIKEPEPVRFLESPYSEPAQTGSGSGSVPGRTGTDATPRHTGSIYAHIVDCGMSHVQVHNSSNDPFIIPDNTRLGVLMEYDVEGCSMADVDSFNLAGAETVDRRLRQEFLQRALYRLLVCVPMTNIDHWYVLVANRPTWSVV